jgi:hypothetical protein
LSQNLLHPQVGAFPPTLKLVKLHFPLGSLVSNTSSAVAYLFKSGVFGTVEAARSAMEKKMADMFANKERNASFVAVSHRGRSTSTVAVELQAGGYRSLPAHRSLITSLLAQCWKSIDVECGYLQTR